MTDGKIFNVIENVAITYYYINSEEPFLNTADSEPLEVVDSGMRYDALGALEDTVDELNVGCPLMTVPHSVRRQLPQAVLNFSGCLSASAISNVEPMAAMEERGRSSASAAAAVEPRAAKPEVGRLSASTISNVELMADKLGSRRPSASAAAAVEPRAAKPEVGRQSASTVKPATAKQTVGRSSTSIITAVESMVAKQEHG